MMIPVRFSRNWTRATCIMAEHTSPAMYKHRYNFTVEILQSGQSAPYQDSEFGYRITDQSTPEFREERIRAFCTRILRFAYEKEAQTDWSQPYIKKFIKISDRTYEYWVVIPYTD